jgi:hypothetical protein
MQRQFQAPVPLPRERPNARQGSGSACCNGSCCGVQVFSAKPTLLLQTLQELVTRHKPCTAEAGCRSFSLEMNECLTLFSLNSLKKNSDPQGLIPRLNLFQMGINRLSMDSSSQQRNVHAFVQSNGSPRQSLAARRSAVRPCHRRITSSRGDLGRDVEEGEGGITVNT